LSYLRRILHNQTWVEDAFQDIQLKLIEDNHRRLKSFKARTSAAAFRIYLLAIARSSAFAILRREAKHVGIEDPDAYAGKNDVPWSQLMQVRGELVERLRKIYAISKKKDLEIERDILVVLLSKLSTFASKELAEMDLLEISQGDVYNVIYRLKERIANDDIFLRDFLE
jgi:DNA-directed RNA polymerase specialized sigma24 family protein